MSLQTYEDNTRQPINAPWSSEEDDILRAKWAEGLTGTEITFYLPLRTRESVLGRVRRLDLPMRAWRNSLTSPVIWAAKPTHVVRPETPFTILSLKHNECHWPMWVDDTPAADRRYCGAAVDNSTALPYCDCHRLKRSRPPARPRNEKPEKHPGGG